MEAQEEAMQKRLLVVAKKMDSFFVDTHQKFEDYRKKKVKEYFRLVMLLITLCVGLLSQFLSPVM